MHVRKINPAELHPQLSCYLLYEAFLDYRWLFPPTPHSSDFLAVSQDALYSLLHTGLSFISIITLLCDVGFATSLGGRQKSLTLQGQAAHSDVLCLLQGQDF